ncbi:ribonuclease P protein component [Candidatus Dojkabacteria bacterium]|nr:ribonuclease P protein component [Candidatus Dojkabacteria bacterium]
MRFELTRTRNSQEEDNLLPKKHRLKTKADFDRVYKQGRKYYSKNFQLIVASRSKDTLPEVFKLPRFGFVASKKVGKAVSRNKAKRMLREVVQAEFEGLKNTFEAVFVAFNTLPEQDIETIRNEVLDVLKKAELYH